MEIEDSFEHPKEVAHSLYDEFPDKNDVPKADLYFTDFSGALFKLTCLNKFSDCKKLSMRKREKLQSICTLDQDEKSIYAIEIGNNSMRVFDKLSHDRVYKDV